MVVDNVRDMEKLHKCDMCGASWLLEGLQKYEKSLQDAATSKVDPVKYNPLRQWDKKPSMQRKKNNGVGVYLFWIALAVAAYFTSRYYFTKDNDVGQTPINTEQTEPQTQNRLAPSGYTPQTHEWGTENPQPQKQPDKPKPPNLVRKNGFYYEASDVNLNTPYCVFCYNNRKQLNKTRGKECEVCKRGALQGTTRGEPQPPQPFSFKRYKNGKEVKRDTW